MTQLRILFAFIVFIMVASGPAISQKSGEKIKFVPLKSFTFTSKAFQIYKRSKRKVAVLKVNSKGVVYAAKGYKMAVTSDKKYVSIVPESASFIVNSGIDAHPANDGIYWCVCPSYPDDCTWETYGRPTGTELELVCEGSCECGIFFEADDTGGIAEYATADGGYY